MTRPHPYPQTPAGTSVHSTLAPAAPTNDQDDFLPMPFPTFSPSISHPHPDVHPAPTSHSHPHPHYSQSQSQSQSQPHSPALSSRGSASSRLATPSPSMSQSKSPSNRRAAPSWPSPRVDRQATVAPLSSHELSQTANTPRIIRDSSCVLSPAFARSGYSFGDAAPNGMPGHGAIRLASPISLSPGRPNPPHPQGRVNVSGVPQSYIVNRLHSFAEKFWWEPESADVRVFIPVDTRKPQNSGRAPPSPMPDSAFSAHSNQPGHSYWPLTPVARDLVATAAIGQATKGDQKNVVASHSVNGGRRNSLPDDASDHVIVFPLHKDYLLTQSILFRSLLSSAPDRSHLDLARSQNPSSFAGRPEPRLAPSSLRPGLHQFGPTSAPMAAGVNSAGQGSSSGGKQPDSRGSLRLRGAKLLPTRDGDPCACYVPVPDPASFGVLLHWMYWGEVEMLERALNTGLCNWQGLVRNIEYLGMDDSIKRVMSKWWRRWVKTDVGRQGSEPGADASSTKAKPRSTEKHSDNVGVHGAKARAEGLGSDGDVDDDVDDEDDGLEDREEVDQAEYGQDRKAHSQRDRQAGVEGQLKPVLRREHEAGGRVSRVWRRENGPREEGGDREWDRNREREGSHGRSGCGRADGDGTGVQGADGDEVGVRDEGTDMDTDMELGDGPGPPDEYAVTEERLRSLMGAL